MKSAAGRIFFWLAPLAACLWIHWWGLKAWFWADDFAWLGLHNLVQSPVGLLHALFEPFAQGTIRPWGERGYFLLFYRLFGLDALPYRSLAFATQFGNLLLLFWIVRKLGGSRMAACMAGILWTANAAMVLPMAWSSTYNQLLCAFFLLAAFALYLADRYWLQVAVFLLGFGALEVNVVYPALLLAWLLLSRRSVKPALPLLGISAAYVLIHRHFAPVPAAGPYAPHLGISLFRTLYGYWKAVWVPPVWFTLRENTPWVGGAAILAITAAMAWCAVRAGAAVRFFLLWFLITLAPVLPFGAHVSDYYPAIPSLGLVTAVCLSQPTWRGRFRGLPAALACLYLYFQLPLTLRYSRSHSESSRQVRTLVLGVLRARQLHPSQAILLTNVSADLFLSSLAHYPFRAIGVPDVYLAPGALPRVPAQYNNPSEMQLPPGPTLHALRKDEAVVYQTGGPVLKNVTAAFFVNAINKFSPEAPSFVDLGNRFMAYLLGSTWYPIEEAYRWMPRAAAIRIAGPRTPTEKLVITGYCPQELTRLGPLPLFISIDGIRISELALRQPDLFFTRIVDVPLNFLGRGSIELGLEVGRTFQEAADTRPRGVALRRVEIREP